MTSLGVETVSDGEAMLLVVAVLAVTWPATGVLLWKQRSRRLKKHDDHLRYMAGRFPDRP